MRKGVLGVGGGGREDGSEMAEKNWRGFAHIPRRARLDPSCHVDPCLHQILPGPRERIDQEHEQEAGIDADVVITHGPDRIHIRAVGGADIRPARREDLQVPARRRIRVLKAVVRQEGQTRTLVTRRQDAEVALDELLGAGPALGHALRAPVEKNPIVDEADDVASQPAGPAGSDEFQHVRVHHGRLLEDAFGARRRRDVVQVPVEEEAEEGLGKPGEEGLHAEDVEREEHLDQGIARNDPFLRLTRIWSAPDLYEMNAAMEATRV